MCTRPYLTRLTKGLNSVLIPVGCGKCPECLQKKQRELSLRIQFDVNSPRCFDSLFCTLTYDDKHLEYGIVDEKTGEVFDKLPSVSRETAQKYLKRIRKSLDYDPEQTKLYYYLTGEYGDRTKRPHYHMIIYMLGNNTCKMSLLDACKKNWHYSDFDQVPIEQCFQTIQSEGASMYVAKHQVKRCRGTELQAPYFQLRSKGIGSEFFTQYPKEVKFLIDNGFLWLKNKYKVTCPRYFADKLKLNKNYYVPENFKNLINILNEKHFKQTNELNKYLSKRYFETHGKISFDDAVKEYFRQKVKKDGYDDQYYDVIYKNYSQSKKL